MGDMQNYVDNNLRLTKRSAGEADSGAGREFTGLASITWTRFPKAAWYGSQPESLVVGDVDVFLVEDDRSMISLVRTLLKTEGIDLLAAETFHEAILALQETRPRLLLVDLGLPDGSGLEIARIVRGWRYFPRIPIVALTASSGKAGDAWEAGFCGFIPKPFAAKPFRDMVTSLLSAPHTGN
jgi:CheY-like chemotaxis protein